MGKGNYLRAFYLINPKKLDSGMVECEDFKTGRKWIVSERVFTKFRRTGFLILPVKLENMIYDIFKDKNYSQLSYKEKLEIIKVLLELASKN